VTEYNRIYIAGEWRSGQGHGELVVENPATEQILGAVADSAQDEVEAAVRAARAAFPAWSATSAKERAEKLHSLVAALWARADEMARLISLEVGTPLRLSSAFQTKMPIAVLAGYADLCGQLDSEERIGNSLILREPAGVAVAITPWNYPLAQIAFKLGPALAAGCTFVLKPSEVAPGAALVLFDALHEAGFPPGVVNLVTGGPTVGQTLVSHPDADVVSFTGSVPVGRQVAAAAATSAKRVTLELGGKSASVVLDDADFEKAVRASVGSAFMNSGQTCAAWTRLVVPAERMAEAADIAKEMAKGLVLGDPFDPTTKMGPVVSEVQRARVRRHIQDAIGSGAALVTGGPETPEGLPQGYFVEPTVFAGVDPDSRLAQEEVFGPVLAILAHQGDDDALEIANNSVYGLHGAVWSEDDERASKFARRMRTGNVDVNGGAFNPLAPFGGYKQSGYGREKGAYGLGEFQEIKSIQY
jgi:aldehyde dehydrogenase (NAD+)